MLPARRALSRSLVGHWSTIFTVAFTLLLFQGTPFSVKVAPFTSASVKVAQPVSGRVSSPEICTPIWVELRTKENFDVPHAPVGRVGESSVTDAALSSSGRCAALIWTLGLKVGCGATLKIDAIESPLFA